MHGMQPQLSHPAIHPPQAWSGWGLVHRLELDDCMLSHLYGMYAHMLAIMWDKTAT